MPKMHIITFHGKPANYRTLKRLEDGMCDSNELDAYMVARTAKACKQVFIYFVCTHGFAWEDRTPGIECTEMEVVLPPTLMDICRIGIRNMMIRDNS